MVNQDIILVGDGKLKSVDALVGGEILTLNNEQFYRISNYDKMQPFLMNIVSDSDLWMFISSNGALTAGRQNPDNALFPYYTDDRIHDSQDITGCKTILITKIGQKQFLWEPFSSNYEGLYYTERNIYKNIIGNKIIFEEINRDLLLTFRYSWSNCERFGFVRKSEIINDSDNDVSVNVIDGLLNILPSGIDRKFQLEYSTLIDAYKKNELIKDTTLALYTLSSIPTDRAEPNEALQATTVWSVGLSDSKVLLSTRQLSAFKKGFQVTKEMNTQGERGAYLLQSEVKLSSSEKSGWYIVSDINKDQSDVAVIASTINSKYKIVELLENEILSDSKNLAKKVANADGFQLTNDHLNTFRHYSNVTFNIMRGGIFEENYDIDKVDFCLFVKKANRMLWHKYEELLSQLPDKISIANLINDSEKLGDYNFQRLCYEYLPLSFSRRHGDPSRPWNQFSINIKDNDGKKVLNYQGNWRDIFQNWEALGHSFPNYLENMITKFVNASTADGYNPYRVTRDGFEWEELDPHDPWSYIGYWGDHQIIYLLKLLEQSAKYHPGTLQSLLTKEIFTYANVPYRIKSFEKIIKDPHHTVEFDFELNESIKEKVKEIGEDGKLLWNKNGEIHYVCLAEKLIVPVLIKISNFVPEAGIWMNTQRPEWNDANNALVGFGASMVTLYYLRRAIVFCAGLFNPSDTGAVILSEEVHKLLLDIKNVLAKHKYLLNGKISDSGRRKIVNELGEAGSDYRAIIYSNGFSGRKQSIDLTEIQQLFSIILDFINHSIRANEGEDKLYHSYNVLGFSSNDIISVRHLSEMLEGQTAVLSSGYLSVEESIILLESLKKSKLYRSDQGSYILYPDRVLDRFIDKNIVREELISRSNILMKHLEGNDKSLVIRDVDGAVHFNSQFKNARVLSDTIHQDGFENIDLKEEGILLEIYESVFDHQSFTGRSCTFYKYEGLGSIYWHMVSKLLLAVQEIFNNAVDAKKELIFLDKLKKSYSEIKAGIGSHKNPYIYGAFPTDAYSHTPKNMGAQQPGMTGQVKEDIISRFGELGVFVINGCIHFSLAMLDMSEFLLKSQVYNYWDINNTHQSLMLNPGMLAFTFCQVPVIYILSEENKVVISYKDGTEEEIAGHTINKPLSQKIFDRDGSVLRVKVLINKLGLNNN